MIFRSGAVPIQRDCLQVVVVLEDHRLPIVREAGDAVCGLFPHMVVFSIHELTGALAW